MVASFVRNDDLTETRSGSACTQISIVGVVEQRAPRSAPGRRNKIAARTKPERSDGLLALLFTFPMKCVVKLDGPIVQILTSFI